MGENLTKGVKIPYEKENFALQFQAPGAKRWTTEENRSRRHESALNHLRKKTTQAGACGRQITSINHHRPHFVTFQAVAPIEEFQFDEEGNLQDLRAELLDE